MRGGKAAKSSFLRYHIRCYAATVVSAPSPRKNIVVGGDKCPKTRLTWTEPLTPLARVFDSPKYWSEFCKSNSGQIKPHKGAGGLFGYLDLIDPKSGFKKAAQRALLHASALVEAVCNAYITNDQAQLRWTVKRLDRVSDILCSVLDAAELVQNVHPDQFVVKEANSAHAMLSNYLNQLNTHTQLYQALKTTVETPSIAQHLTSDEHRVAALLLADFEKSGIHMPDAMRQRFVDLSDRILELGQAFAASAYPAVSEVEIENASKRLDGVPAHIVQQGFALRRKQLANNTARRGFGFLKREEAAADDVAVFSVSSPSAITILKTARDEGVRKLMFTALNSGADWQIETLENMLRTRGELAQLVGKSSFAEMSLQEKMAGKPEVVVNFLNALADLHKPLALADIARLSQVKQAHSPNSSTPYLINAWDRLFFSQFISSTASSSFAAPNPFLSSHSTSHTSNSDNLSSYFTVGQTFAGLSNLLNALYGVRFNPVPLSSPSEVWHEDVRKLEVLHETEGLVGIVYCDVFKRPFSPGQNSAWKYDSAAHFTIRCSRRVDDDEEDFAASPSRISNLVEHRMSGLGDLSMLRNEEVLRKMWSPQSRSSKTYQLPVVALVTSFDRVEREGSPSLLPLSEVETLFHEIGHVIHSMLARTDLQHIAGTRCPLDFVEVPSNFLERFARNPAVLSTFARHYRTGAPLDLDLLRKHRAASLALNSLEVQHQLIMALLDQIYHSTAALDPNFSSTQALKELQSRAHVIPFVEGTAWQVQFSHLFSYGACYYSYFWARRWANRVYDKLFESEDGTWREAGEQVNRELLSWGGGRDPFIGLEKLGVLEPGDREGNIKVTLRDLGVEE